MKTNTRIVKARIVNGETVYTVKVDNHTIHNASRNEIIPPNRNDAIIW